MASVVSCIRFGIIYCGAALKKWEVDAVQALLALPGIELALRVQLTLDDPAPPPANRWCWNVYQQWLYQPSALRLEPEPTGLVRQSPLLVAAAGWLGSRPHLTTATVAAVQEYELDFVLDFTAVAGAAQPGLLARLGAWVFCFGAWATELSAPVGVREVFSQALTVAAELRQCLGTGQPMVLREGVLRTTPHSASQTADNLYAEAASWPAASCAQLLAGCSLVGSSAPLAAAAPVFRPPTNAAMLAWAIRLGKHKIQHLYHTYLRADQWNIGVVNCPIADFLHPASLEGAHVDAPALPNRNVFYADCFARPEEAGPAVYFELYDYRKRRGIIARLPYPWPGRAAPTEVMRFPFHLSYPFLFGPYCLPEAGLTNGIRLYDLRNPVTDPAAGQVLLDVPGVDATLLEHEGRYWLFYTRLDRDPMLNLFVAYADALTGPWYEHPRNPVKTDIRGARPAGPFFRHAGRLYRPAQNCVPDYGHGITMQEVTTLTTTDYAERPVASLTSLHPGYPAGMHTIAALDETRTLIDFKRYRFIPMASLLALWAPVSALIYGKAGRRKPPVLPPANAARAVSTGTKAG